MNELLSRIQRAVRTGSFDFSMKARLEMQADDLSQDDIVESILNATVVYKSIRSRRPDRKETEYLHIIISPDSSGVMIYSKGKLTKYGATEIYYFLVSAKRSD